LHKLRKCSGVAAGLIAVFLLACPQFEGSQAQAQTHAAKKKAERKAAAPKGAAERQEERATFTAQDEDAALVPGIPDACGAIPTASLLGSCRR